MGGYKLLSWAGVRLDVEGKSLVIDAVEGIGSFQAAMGDPREPLRHDLDAEATLPGFAQREGVKARIAPAGENIGW
jgi:hypothetical protein